MLKILVYNFLQYFCSLSLEQVIHLPFTNLVVSYKKQELLTFREHQGSPPVFGGIHVAHLFNFLSGVLFVFVLCLVYPMLPVSLDCSFLITPSVFSNVYLH